MPQVLGQLKHLIDGVPEYFSLVMQHVTPLAPIAFLVLLYCTGVLLVLVHVYLLCRGHGGVASLVSLIFWCIFPLSLLMVKLSGLDWEVSDICPYITRLGPPL